MTSSPSFVHLTADFIGTPASQLRDDTLLNGLLVAAAGAAGLSATVAPTVQHFPNHDSGELLLLDGCRISLHAFPERELLLLDILTVATYDVRKALEVFTRRLVAREVLSEQRARG